MMARWTSTPPVATPVSRKRMFTSNQHHDPATDMLGPSAPVANPDSLSDPDAAAEHLLQHWYQVRHVFTKLRADGPTDRCSIPVALDRLADAFPLVARSALRAVMEEATAGSDAVNYDAFMSAVRKWAGPGDNVGSQREASRFAAKGIMDKRMQKVLKQPDAAVPLGTRRPDHALGHSALNCPYGIEGDAERMEAIFHTYMDRRVDSIQKFFIDMDSNNDGKLSYSEFESAMLRMDPETPRPAISALIRALDEGHKGFITLNDIRSNFTVEFMKSKAHRNSPGHRNILAWPNETQEYDAGALAPRPPAGTKRASGARRPQPKLAPVNTKSQVLRLEAIRETMRESDPLRAEKMRQQGNLKEAKPLRSQLKHEGIVGFHGRPV